MANGKRVQFPRGTRTEEDAITGLPGELRVDLDRKTVHVHDGMKQGGYPLATEDFVEQALKGGGADSSGVGTVVLYSSVADLKAAAPAVSQLAILKEEGREDSFVWASGSGDAGDITSDIQGYWKRLDSQAGLAIQFWRAGLINLQINGTTPASDQEITAWLQADAIKLWDGAAYQAATPTLWMRLFAEVGGYSTGTFTIPARIAEVASEITNLDTIVLSGWYKTTAGATGNPTPAVNLVEHRELTTETAIQTVVVQNDAERGYWIRYRSDNSPLTWTAFSYVAGLLPMRLRAAQVEVATADDALESGFYRLTDQTSLVTIRKDSNNIAQFRITTAGVPGVRVRTAGTWSSWVDSSQVGHIHDDRYFTEAEVTSLLAGKAALVHNHDDRYYTEAEVNSLIAGKASTDPAFGIGAVIAGQPTFDIRHPPGTTGSWTIGMQYMDNGGAWQFVYVSGVFRYLGATGTTTALVHLFQRIG